MTARARILILTTRTTPSDRWAELVDSLGYEALPVEPETALAQARLARADGALAEPDFNPPLLKQLLEGHGGLPGLPIAFVHDDVGDAAARVAATPYALPAHHRRSAGFAKPPPSGM